MLEEKSLIQPLFLHILNIFKHITQSGVIHTFNLKAFQVQLMANMFQLYNCFLFFVKTSDRTQVPEPIILMLKCAVKIFF